MSEMRRRIRERLSPGGTPSLPELHPGEKDVESVEIAHEARTTSLEDPDAGRGDAFLDTGRITLTRPRTTPTSTAGRPDIPTHSAAHVLRVLHLDRHLADMATEMQHWVERARQEAAGRGATGRNSGPSPSQPHLSGAPIMYVM